MEGLIKNVLTMFPVWESEIWNFIKRKSYKEAEESLCGFLKQLPEEEWGAVYWKGILGGIPVVRAGIDNATWKNDIVPLILNAVVKSATSERVTWVYRGLDYKTLTMFHKALFETIPGNKVEEKLMWLKTNKPSVYTLFTASPMQVLGTNSFMLPKTLLFDESDVVEEKFNSLGSALKTALFSSKMADVIFRVCNANHLSEEKVAAVAYILGKIFLGITHIDDFGKELREKLFLDGQTSNAIVNEIKERVLSKNLEDIERVYEPMNDVLNRIKDVGVKNTVDSEKFVTDNLASGKDGPLIIHEIKPEVVEEQKRPSFLSSLPFKIFSKKPATEEAPTIKARVETPQLKSVNQKEEKVVHYSELRTPLAPLDKGSDVVRLEGLGAEPPHETPPPQLEKKITKLSEFMKQQKENPNS